MTPRGMLAFIGACAFIMTAAYLVYLAASWNQYQIDRDKRDQTINDLLDRIKPPGPVIVVDPG